VLRHGWNAVAYQILNPGMSLWLDPQGEAVVGYAAHGGVRVVAGAPVCAPERLARVAGDVEADAAAAGARVCYFGAGERLERLYAASARHALVLLGAQPVWDPVAWAETVRGKALLRSQINRAANKGGDGVGVAERGGARAPGAPRGARGVARHARPPHAALPRRARDARPPRRPPGVRRRARGGRRGLPRRHPGARARGVAHRAVAARARRAERHGDDARGPNFDGLDGFKARLAPAR
jgi:hypothetical protein